jgi:hypothetical protein
MNKHCCWLFTKISMNEFTLALNLLQCIQLWITDSLDDLLAIDVVDLNYAVNGITCVADLVNDVLRLKSFVPQVSVNQPFLRPKSILQPCPANMTGTSPVMNDYLCQLFKGTLFQGYRRRLYLLGFCEHISIHLHISQAEAWHWG